jgi:hypothetical protein
MLNQDQKGGWNTRLSSLAIALSIILLPACANNGQQAQVPGTTTAEKENVTAPDVSQKTDALIGQLITVRSQSINRLSDNVFTITDNEVWGGERIVVVNNTGQPVNLPEPQDARLQVTGTVAKFDVNALKQQYSSVDLGQPSSYQEYEGMPAIIAQSIALAPIPGEIGENPQLYYNKVIAVPAEVTKIYNTEAFVLADNTILGDNPLLVLVTNQIKDNAPIKEGETIVATGILRPFVAADLQREYNLNWDAQLLEQLETAHNNQSVLIVQGIYPSALPQSAK